MIFEGKIKQHLQLDITELLNCLPEEDDPVWLLDTWRQNKFEVHADTLCIRAIAQLPVWSGLSVSLVKDNPMYDNKLVGEIRKLAEPIAEKVGGGISMASLILLPANCTVTPHVDGTPLHRIHRCHLPIKTNTETIFVIDDENFHLEQGIVYEINNQLMHSVYNRGKTARIHLLVDVLPNASI